MQTSPATHNKTTDRRRLLGWIAGIVLITLICYAPVFSGSKAFTNWDDGGYVTDQPLITGLDAAHIRQLFAPDAVVMYNYHPLTMLSLAIDYQRGFDADTGTVSIVPFVRTNVLLHLINTALVFLLLLRLCRPGQLLPAALAALIFGIHPLHVESVAWISERKDVLYCFFFLLSCLTYIRYLTSHKLVWLGLSVGLFLAACLSKAMAVPLPFILVLMDLWYRRKLGARLLLEKLPYLAVAVIIGLHTLTAQQGAIAAFTAYTVPQRILFAAGAFCLYCFRLVVPLPLSAFYPYPDIDGGLSAWWYLAVGLALAVIGLPLWLVRRDPVKLRAWLLGMGFFILMIALVLPVMTVGSALMADRYTYVSSIGLLFLIPALAGPAFGETRTRKIATGIGAAFVLFFAVRTYQRIPVWEDSGTLWSDVIAQYPITVSGGRVRHAGAKVAYKNMADYYASARQYDSAFAYLQVLTAAGTRDAAVWANLGDVYVTRKDYPRAIDALSRSIALDSTNAETYLKRAIVQANSNNYPEAIRNLDQVIRLKPDDAQAKDMREKMRKFLK